ncbi:MAG: DUF177 domain-containing protein [Clostridiales bacterium]|nr:DUF177 domain-containing protein [Clostridiales bacterium]
MGNSVIKIAVAKKGFGAYIHQVLDFEIKRIEICGRMLVPATPVKVDLKYCYDGDAINADGEISVSFYESCARCNKEFVMPFSYSFSEKFYSENYKGDEFPHDFAIEDEESFIYSGETLDLYDFVYTTIVLNVPLHSLCNEDCTSLAQNEQEQCEEEAAPNSLKAKLTEALRKQN